MAKRAIYAFPDYAAAVADVGKENLVSLLGQKGAGLSELAGAGLPVPKGFTITSDAIRAFFAADPPALPDDLWTEITAAVAALQDSLERGFASGEKPFLLAIRNSCAVSMEQTVLSLFQIGLNAETVAALVQGTENPKFFWLLYLRWIQQYATAYLQFDAEKLAEPLAALLAEKNLQSEAELDLDDLTALCNSIKELMEAEGTPFAEDPLLQLKAGIEKVLSSWNSEQATEYRKANEIPQDAPIAICVMVHLWTNLSDSSAIGSTLTRNPATGDPAMVGSFVANVTGADYLAKTKQPHQIAALEGVNQPAYEKLGELNRLLEKYYKLVAEVDFIIENSDVYFLKSRSVPGNIVSNLKLGVDFVNDGILTKEETVKNLTTATFDFLTNPFFKPEDLENNAEKVIVRGDAISPGYIVGQICLSGEKAEELAGQEQDPILILDKYSDQESAGFLVSRGYISFKDRANSPAVALARQQKIAAVFKCKFKVDLDEGTVTFGQQTLREGDFVSIDGKAGVVYSGQVPITRLNPEENPEILQILTWADDIRHAATGGLAIYANADSAEAVQRGRGLGAEGIGLYRTDQFLIGERTDIIQRLLLTDDAEDREAALQELEEGLTADFSALFDSLSGFPSFIRLSDPSIQEYLPSVFELIEEVTILQAKKAAGAEVEAEELQDRERTLERVSLYYEDNPGVGMRGVRLSVCIPGLLRVQLRAAIEGLQAATERAGQPQAQLIVPFALCDGEVARVRTELAAATAAINKEHESPVSIELGAAIEVPRAAFVIDKITEQADALVFGTNELTELAFGLSREDGEKEWLPRYQELEVFPQSPFEVLDLEGVGEIIRIGTAAARAQKPEIQIGVAGDNTGDPQSVKFLHGIGVSFLSCPAGALPLARLAAAHAVLDTA